MATIQDAQKKAIQDALKNISTKAPPAKSPVDKAQLPPASVGTQPKVTPRDPQVPTTSTQQTSPLLGAQVTPPATNNRTASPPAAPAAIATTPQPTTPQATPTTANINNVKDGSGKSISDYAKMYQEAKLKNDAAGMEAANKAANAIRTSQGAAAQYATKDIQSVQQTATNANIPVADFLKKNGDAVFYNPFNELVEVNGLPIDTSKFVNNNGHYYGSQQDIQNAAGNTQIPGVQYGPDGERIYMQTPQAPTAISGNYTPMTYEQSVAQAYSQLNPEYDKVLKQSMQAADVGLAARGFYGQLPGDVLKLQTAVGINDDRNSAAAQLAQQIQDSSRQNSQWAAQFDANALQNYYNNYSNALQLNWAGNDRTDNNRYRDIQQYQNTTDWQNNQIDRVTARDRASQQFEWDKQNQAYQQQLNAINLQLQQLNVDQIKDPLTKKERQAQYDYLVTQRDNLINEMKNRDIASTVKVTNSQKSGKKPSTTQTKQTIKNQTDAVLNKLPADQALKELENMSSDYVQQFGLSAYNSTKKALESKTKAKTSPGW